LNPRSRKALDVSLAPGAIDDEPATPASADERDVGRRFFND